MIVAAKKLTPLGQNAIFFQPSSYHAIAVSSIILKTFKNLARPSPLVFCGRELLSVQQAEHLENILTEDENIDHDADVKSLPNLIHGRKILKGLPITSFVKIATTSFVVIAVETSFVITAVTTSFVVTAVTTNLVVTVIGQN